MKDTTSNLKLLSKFALIEVFNLPIKKKKPGMPLSNYKHQHFFFFPFLLPLLYQSILQLVFYIFILLGFSNNLS